MAVFVDKEANKVIAFLNRTRDGPFEGRVQTFTHTDNGKEFVNNSVSKWCLDNGSENITGRPYHPQSQGQVELNIKLFRAFTWPIG